MKFISHRGNTRGLDPKLQNHPLCIDKVLALNYDCEIDVWKKGTDLFLGHDKPQYLISLQWLLERGTQLWVHAKNFAAFDFLTYMVDLNCFWHENDSFTLTSKGYIWTLPGKEVSDKSVIVTNDYDRYGNAYAVCSDYLF